MDADDVSPSLESAAFERWDALTSASDTSSSSDVAASSVPEPVSAPPATDAGTTPVEAKPDAPTAEGTTPEPAVEPGVATPEPTSHAKWIAKYGDPNKAADAARENDNRLAQMVPQFEATKRELEELKAKLVQPGTTPEPAAAEPTTPAPAPQAVAPEQIEQWVAQQVAQDQYSRQWDSEFRANKARLNVLNDPASPESIPAAASEVAKLSAWLQFPGLDDFTKKEYQGSLELATTRHERLLIEAQRREMSNAGLKQQFDARANQYRSQINEHYQSQARAAQQAQEFNTQVARHAKELEKAWDPGLTRAVKDNNIPEDLVADFKEDVRNAALAKLESGIKVEDLDKFFSDHAKRFTERLDKYHRQKAAQYAKDATARATSPAPPPSVVPQVQPTISDDLGKQADAVARAAWNQHFAGRA